MTTELIPDSMVEDHQISLREEDNAVEAQWGKWTLTFQRGGNGGGREVRLTDRDTKTLQTALNVTIGTPGLPRLEDVAERAIDAAAEAQWNRIPGSDEHPYSALKASAKYDLKEALQPIVMAALQAAGIR